MSTHNKRPNLSNRIFHVLETGPQKPSVLRGLAKSEEEFERVIGKLFLLGVVRWIGKKRGRLLARLS